MMKAIILASAISLLMAINLSVAAAAAENNFALVEKSIAAQDFKTAYQELDRLAKTGDAQAIYGLASLTASGQGTNKDEKKALQLFEQAASKNYPLAHYALGHAYLSGQLGLKADSNKGKNHLEKAAAQYDPAAIDLALLFFSEEQPNSQQKGMKVLEPLIKKQNPQALYTKAMYDISLGMKNKNMTPLNAGISSISELAAKGYIPALMAAGNLMAGGIIVEQDLPEARKIFDALSKENVPNAKESLVEVNKMIAEQAKAPKTTSKSKK